MKKKILLFTRMSKDANRSTRTLKQKGPISSRWVTREKAKDNATTRKPVDLFEKRLNHIRVHLLSNRIPGKLTFAEPTLVFDDFLYLGGLRSLQNKKRLSTLNITHVLSVLWIRPRKDSIPPNAKHLFIKADDCVGFNMTPYFEQACQFIEEARLSHGRVLVHCACGVSRSTTLCCAYLIRHQSMTVEQAITQLRSRRSIVTPNSGFLRQLIRFNEQLDRDNKNIDTIVEQFENV